jgi:selenocysteine lyase/cysteine desulfurase
MSFGTQNVANRLLDLGEHLIKGLSAKGYNIVSPRELEQWSGIISFTSSVHDQGKIVRMLRKEHQTEIALREGRLRISPHFYNTEEQMDRLVEALPGH